MEHAGPGATSVTPTRPRSGARFIAAMLPVIGLVGTVALIATSGFQPGPPSRPMPNRLVQQEKIAPAPHRTATRERRRDAPIPVAIIIRGSALDPVARATAPGVAADGSLHVSASLIDSTVGATPPVEAKPVDSPGTAPALVRATPSRDSQARVEQVASLNPVDPPALPNPAWRLYAQHFDAADTRPRIALIVAGTDDYMDAAIEALPPAVTLALDPYARRLPEWIELARAKGHEVLLTLSTPPIGRGQRDAGPMAILSSVDPKENLERLDWALDRAAGFVGVVDIVGNRPAAETDPILAKLGEHGLMLVSGTAVRSETASVPLATGDVVIAPNVPRRELDRRLAQLQDKARRDGQAVGIVVADPALLHHLAAWLASLRNQSIALAPATATIAAKPTGIAKE